MRLVALLLLGACSHAASGPAWPRPHATSADGGESLAPHTASAVAAAATGEDEQAVPDLTLPATPAAATPAATPAAKPTASPDEPVTTEDMVIEINGED